MNTAIHASNMEVVFFGTPEFAGDFLKGLLADSTFEVVGVVTQPDEPVGRKKILTPPPVKMIAEQAGIPVFQPTKLNSEEFKQTIQKLGAEIAVVVAYGRILPQSVLDLFPRGVINVHPSLLPRWRGPSPLNAAIAAGDAKTGISIMKLDDQMDHGPLLAQEIVPLDESETAETLRHKVVTIGVPLLNKTLTDYALGHIEPKPQDDSAATFCKLLTRDDGVINWNESAEVIDRKVRAYTPWPGTSTQGMKIFAVAKTNEKVNVGQVKVVNGRILVGTSTTALEILELQAPAGKRMKAKDFLNGRHDFDGKSFL